jgi:hypothetical protein
VGTLTAMASETNLAMIVPAFLCIDVEHDDSFPQVGDQPWAGFEAAAELIDQVRQPLRDRSGVELLVTWFFKMDSVVERCFGRSDFAVRRHGHLVERLRTQGDAFGIHVHAHRWDEQRGIYSDYTAPWASHCVTVAADTFEGCFGERPQRCRFGGYFMPEAAVDTAIARGVEVDLTAEPGLGPMTDDPSFGHYSTAPSTDFRGYPRFPYRPSRNSAAVPAAYPGDGRPLIEIPLTTYDYHTALSSIRRRFADRVRSRQHQALPLNPWKPWPDPKTYWDLVERSMDEGPVPYVALAARTDAPASATAQRLRRLLQHLPHHPIAARIQFVDPLTFARRFSANEQPQ